MSIAQMPIRQCCVFQGYLEQITLNLEIRNAFQKFPTQLDVQLHRVLLRNQIAFLISKLDITLEIQEYQSHASLLAISQEEFRNTNLGAEVKSYFSLYKYWV